MAQVSFEQSQQMVRENDNSVKFFKLENDGDEAIVRILHDSTADFNIFTLHNVSVGGRFRKINCLRTPQEPVGTCPLCASGNNSTNRIFINMIQYEQMPTGQVVANPVIWERSMAYASKLKNLIDEYGPLSDCIFKIKRNGARGSMETTYDIFYCNPKVYRDDLYPKTEGLFESVRYLGGVIMDKNFDELQQFVTTGQFPAAPQTAATQQTTAYTPKATIADVPFEMTPPPTPSQTVTNPSYATVPQQQGITSTAPGKPTRYY